MTKQAPSAIHRAIAAMIRAEEAAQGLPRGELSSRSGIPVRSLHTYLRTDAEQREMTVGQVDAIARALGYDGAVAFALAATERYQEL